MSDDEYKNQDIVLIIGALLNGTLIVGNLLYQKYAQNKLKEREKKLEDNVLKVENIDKTISNIQGIIKLYFSSKLLSKDIRN